MCKECEENFQTLSKIQKINWVKMSVHPTLISWTFGVGKAFFIMTPNSEVITEKTGKFKYAFQKLQKKKKTKQKTPWRILKHKDLVTKYATYGTDTGLIALINKWKNSTNQ